MVEIKDYIIDYNLLAEQGKLGGLVGRSDELKRIIQILLRFNKNNPVLTGLAGVGKKTVAYGFAKLLSENNVPDELKGYRLVGIDVTGLLIQSVNADEYEENIKRLFATISEGKNILLIKDAGMLIRRDVDDGTREIAKFLKPKVLSGEIKVLLSLDTISFKTYIENDPDLMTVLQVIRFDECNLAEALEITKGSKGRFERHYSVKIDDDGIESAVLLTNRYVKNRLFPEKSIDLVDDACSLLLMDIANGKTDKRVVTKHHMERTIGIWTGIPMDKVQVEDKERLANMDDYLRQRVIGQDEAVKAVSDAFRRSKSGLQDPNRPLGTFLFIGTTGVGKTELAKSLAEFVFYDENSLIRIDMSEFMDKASIVRLVGPPVGSPGYEQGGLLTEAIRNKPYQLILFDEIEKAHPEVMNLMLQLLDEGRLTDSRGVTVDFRNTIVILTSNIAHDVPSYKRISVLTKYLRPELVNRIDDIVSFNQLVENDMLKIVELNLRRLVKKAKAAQNLTLEISLFAKRWFVDELFTSKMGVRALKRLIQHEVENVMAIQIMSGKINYGDVVVIDSPDRTKLEIYAKKHGRQEVPVVEVKQESKPQVVEEKPKVEEEKVVKEVKEKPKAEAKEVVVKEGSKEEVKEFEIKEEPMTEVKEVEVKEDNLKQENEAKNDDIPLVPADEDTKSSEVITQNEEKAHEEDVVNDNEALKENMEEAKAKENSVIIPKDDIKEETNLQISSVENDDASNKNNEYDENDEDKSLNNQPLRQSFNPAIAAAIAKARQATSRIKKTDSDDKK